MTANTYPFENRTVLVTGGGSGMGRAIARGFLENGANVAVCGRRLSALQATLEGYPTERTAALQADLVEAAAADEVVSATVSHFGSLDVVVSNAAVYAGGADITEMAPAQWEMMRATNIDALFHLARAAAPHLVASSGSLVAVSSVSGDNGDWGQAAYNATKHAVNGFVRSLALDYGSRGVRVNAVAPAFTLTDMTAGVGRSQAELAPFVNRIALGRPARPDDVVGAVLFLASPDAAYISGAVLTVDGGTSASTGQPHIE